MIESHYAFHDQNLHGGISVFEGIFLCELTIESDIF